MARHFGVQDYFTGPLEHDLGFELLAGFLALVVLALVWKIFDLKWPFN